MAALEQVMQLRAQGMNDQEIVSTLQQQGVSPGEIDAALNQAQVKNAVAGEEAMAPPMAPPQAGADQMQPSVMGQTAPPQTQDMAQQPPMQDPPMQPQLGAPQEFYPQQPAYQDYGGGADQSFGLDSNTAIELAQQVFEDKSKKMQAKIHELNEIKTINQVKLDHIETRLKQIENIIDKLQISVLDKVGSYGKDLSSIKKEMSLIQGAVKKSHKRHATHHTTTHKPVHKVVKKPVAKKAPRKKPKK